MSLLAGDPSLILGLFILGLLVPALERLPLCDVALLLLLALDLSDPGSLAVLTGLGGFPVILSRPSG